MTAQAEEGISLRKYVIQPLARLPLRIRGILGHQDATTAGTDRTADRPRTLVAAKRPNSSPNSVVLSTTRQPLPMVNVDDWTLVVWVGFCILVVGLAGLTIQVLNQCPHLIAILVGTLLVGLGFYCKVRQHGLLEYLPPRIQRLLLHTSVFDIFFDQNTIARLSRLWSRLFLLAGFKGLSEKTTRQILEQMDDGFVEQMLQPGLAHHLPLAVQRHLLPNPVENIRDRVPVPHWLSTNHQRNGEASARGVQVVPKAGTSRELPTAFTGLPSVRIDRRTAAAIIQYKKAHPVIRPDMPPPISHAMWMVAAPSTSIVAGISTLGLSVFACRKGRYRTAGSILTAGVCLTTAIYNHGVQIKRSTLRYAMENKREDWASVYRGNIMTAHYVAIRLVAKYRW
ncbi:hypothetical protein FOZ60_006700 [Perkinsus olseni]|uniref:Transmembrane protein n=1 Tax=Perkinsus olseni TaxID=32597 RepID=A0A7J6PFY7_PEROL|nr:hypothetical protein FOZ60_006700 [Perkinsus olseni]